MTIVLETRSTKAPGFVLLAAMFLGLTGDAIGADDIDRVLGGTRKEESIDVLLDGAKPANQKDFQARLAAALVQKDPAVRRKQLTELVEVLVRSDGILLPPRDWNAFADAVLAGVDRPALAAFAPKLLRAPENIQFNVSAQSRLNLGLRVALMAGGASFERLKAIHDQCGSVVDLEWLLPALARAGGSKALPILARYRDDAGIIPLGNSQNIRRPACAAVLAAAYAGEKEALERILAWYEEDYVNRPRFAFNVAWSLQEGLKPDYALLDYCQHRLAQAERLLDFLGKDCLAELIARANREGSISLTDYLCRKMEAAGAGDLPVFVQLLEHPSVIVKQHAVQALLERGDAGLRRIADQKLQAFRSSPRGIDRFFATKTLMFLDRARDEALLDEAIQSERNDAVRRRLIDLRSGVW